MKIYVIRHGETVWNSVGIVQGRSANRLSELGKTQVMQSAEKLADKNIDVIISSPVYRTMQTANIINKKLHKKIVKDERITEIHQGIYTKRVKKGLTKQEKDRKNLRLKEDGVESYEEAYERVKLFIEDIKVRYANQTVLIVTHRSIARSVQMVIEFGKYLDKNTSGIHPFENAEFRMFEI